MAAETASSADLQKLQEQVQKLQREIDRMKAQQAAQAQPQHLTGAEDGCLRLSRAHWQLHGRTGQSNTRRVRGVDGGQP